VWTALPALSCRNVRRVIIGSMEDSPRFPELDEGPFSPTRDAGGEAVVPANGTQQAELVSASPSCRRTVQINPSTLSSSSGPSARSALSRGLQLPEMLMRPALARLVKFEVFAVAHRFRSFYLPFLWCL
jgi:hypothetical protein